jgi:hypothetical protein
LVPLQRGLGQERQQDVAGANSEENVTTSFLGYHRQVQHISVERLGLIEIVHVDGGFYDSVDLHGHSSSTITSFPCTLTGKLRTSSSVSGPSAAPVLTLNSVLCQGHVTTSPTIPFSQRPTFMGAGVVNGVEGAGHVEEGDALSFDLHGLAGPWRHVGCCGDLHQLGHGVPPFFNQASTSRSLNLKFHGVP